MDVDEDRFGESVVSVQEVTVVVGFALRMAVRERNQGSLVALWGGLRSRLGLLALASKFSEICTTFKMFSARAGCEARRCSRRCGQSCAG